MGEAFIRHSLRPLGESGWQSSDATRREKARVCLVSSNLDSPSYGIAPVHITFI